MKAVEYLREKLAGFGWDRPLRQEDARRITDRAKQALRSGADPRPVVARELQALMQGAGVK